MRRTLWPKCTLKDHRREIAEILGDPRGQPAWVAEDGDGGIIGFLETSVRNYADGVGRENVGYLEGWYVKPKWRKRGIGQGLVRAAERWAVRRGFSHMGSDTWIGNKGSHRAHLAMGYREAGRDIHYVKRLRPKNARGAEKHDIYKKER